MSSCTVTVRPAALDDAAIVEEFNARLADESEGVILDRAVLREGIRQVLSDAQKGLYFLAVVEGEIAGQTMVTYEWSDWRNGWVWWIQSVYVRPEFRRQGVLRVLHAHVLEQARAREVRAVRLYVVHDNHVARKAYAALGLLDSEYLVLIQDGLGEE